MRKVAKEPRPSDISTELVKTEKLLRHSHRFIMIMARYVVFKIAPIFGECLQAASSVRAAHLRVHSSALCTDTTVMLPFRCLAALASELLYIRLRESVSENKMAASAMEASVMEDAFKEKAEELSQMYGGLPTEEKPLLLYGTFGKRTASSSKTCRRRTLLPASCSRTSSTCSPKSTFHSGRTSTSTGEPAVGRLASPLLEHDSWCGRALPHFANPGGE